MTPSGSRDSAPLDQLLSAAVTRDMRRQFTELARRGNRSVSAEVRAALAAWLDRRAPAKCECIYCAAGTPCPWGHQYRQASHTGRRDVAIG